MSFLSPFAALAAAAVAVPLLLLVYFLKLRRRYLRIASTLLWRSTFEDLEVNAPFRRLRWSLLLLLQLLILTALLLALAQPVAGGQESAASRIVLVIDRSASMSARDAEGGATRLDAAKAAAREMVQRLTRGSGTSQIMVIAYGRSASVISSFDFDRAAVLVAIDSIEPSDEVANLDAALQLAAAFAGDTEDIGAQAGDVVLFSDGAVAPAREAMGHRLRVGRFRYVHVGPAREIDNLGIVSFSVRRDYEDPARVLVFARLLNAGPETMSPVVTLRLDDAVADVKQVRVPGIQAARSADAERDDVSPGEATVSFALVMEGGGVLSLAHNHRDALPADDVAWLVVPPPLQPRIVIVHAGPPDPFTHDLVQMLDPASIELMRLDRFSELDERMLDSGREYDLIVFDRVSGHRLPGVPSITFGGVPRGMSATEPGREGGRRILSWERQHPVMRHVSLDPVVYAGFGGYELPAAATPLALGPHGPVMALVRTRNARHVLVGFELARSNWPMHVSIAVFLQNALDHLTLMTPAASRSSSAAAGDAGGAGIVFQPGETVTVRAAPTASEIMIRGPSEMTVPTEPGAVRSLPALSRAGLYEIDGATPPMDRLALSVLSDVQSDIRPRTHLIVNAESAAGGAAEGIVPRELWPWLLAAGLALLMFEWLAYCRKVRG